MAGRRSKLPLWAFGLTFVGLLLAVGVREKLVGSGTGARVQVPTPLSSATSVGGWRGPAALEAAGLGLIFAPLHTDPERQVFDAAVLAERLGLGPGQPYRLEVNATGGAQLGALLAAARAGQLSIEDEAGRAAALLFDSSADVAPGAGPVLRLFAPEATLDPTAGGRLVFWGRPLESAARLLGPDFEWKLAPSAVPRGDLPLFVASRSQPREPAAR